MRRIGKILLFLALWYGLLLLGGGSIGVIELVVSFVLLAAAFYAVSRLAKLGSK